MRPQTKDQIKDVGIALIALIIVLFLIYIAIILLGMHSKNQEAKEQTFLVVNVTDGDTFEIATGEIIRLICVDAPERGEEGYKVARDFLSDLILDKEVRLEMDENVSSHPQESEDTYGRFLRYVYVKDEENESNEIFVNKEIVKAGKAVLFPYGNSTEKCDEIAGK